MSENTTTRVERVVLHVESSGGDFTIIDAGIRKLASMNRLLEISERRFANLLNIASRNPFAGKSDASGGFGFMGQLKLWEQQQKAQQEAVKRASGSARISVDIPADHISAFVSGKVQLLVTAAEIEARLAGPVHIKGSEPVGGGGGGSGRSGSSPGLAGSGKYGMPIAITRTAESTTRQYRVVGSDGRAQIITTRQDAPPKGSVHPQPEEDISARVAIGARKARTDAEQAERNRRAANLREERRQNLADLMADGRERAIADRRSRQNRIGQENEQQKQLQAEKLSQAERVRMQDEIELANAMADAREAARKNRRDQQNRAGSLDERSKSRELARQKAEDAKRLADEISLANAMADGREKARANRRDQQNRAGQSEEAQRKVAKKAEVEADKAAVAQYKLAESTRYVGRNMLENVQKVAAWTTSVAVLYGTVGLARSGLSSLIETGFQSARLQQVFRGSAAEASKLTDDILSLASANGRSTAEAMESAIQWARLGYNRIQINEAVRVSLMAANVAEITAGEATEHLSALTAVYRLRVSELDGVLGMLNNTSNTYSVSNKDMLEGLSRTAAVAKQAGIPLAELIGLIGAGVGATKQSGANIGNAIKSITGALSAGDKLKLLRENYNFEGTDGNGALKNMSEILSELFIAYNKMSEAERRSMLFDVAGKNQASRMAAILDNYVKSQTLAIAAQLNLNSAEEENSRITATLKSQLAGLVAEWGRFVNQQGNRGPVQALQEVTKSMQNVLKLANMPVANQVFTGLEYIGIGIAAKMALASFQMAKVGEKGSIIRNTFAGVKQAANEAGAAFNNVAKQGASMWWLGGAGKGMFAADVAKSSVAVRGLSVAMIGLADVVAPMLILWAVMKGVNETMEAVGLTSDRMSEKVGKLDSSANRAANAANAHEQRARLMLNAQRVFEQSNSTKDSRSALALRLGEAFAPYESGDDAKVKADKDKLRDSRQKELQQIAGIQNEEERLAKSRAFFSREHASALEMQMRKRRQEREFLAQQVDSYDAEIRRLKASPLGSKQSIRELEEKKEGAYNQRIQSFLEDTQDNEAASAAFRQNDILFRSYSESQKSMITELKQLWSELPGDSHLDRLNKDIAAQEVILGLLNQQLKIKSEQARMAGLPGSGATEAEAIASSKRTDAANIRRKALEDFSKATGVFDEDGNAQRMDPMLWADNYAKGRIGTATADSVKQFQQQFPAEAKLALSKLAKAEGLGDEADKISKGVSKARSNTDYQRLVEERDETRKNAADAEVELARLRSMEQAAALGDRRSVALRFAKATGDAFGFGDGEGAQTVNRITGLRASASALGVAAAMHPDQQGADADNLRVQALEHRVELSDELIKAELRLIELGREEHNLIVSKNREFQRGLLTAGPAELLRKLAIAQVGKVNTGQFFAFGTDARKDILDRPENSRELIENRRTQAALRGAGVGSGDLSSVQSAFLDGTKARREIYGSAAPVEINEAARSVVTQFTALTSVTARLVQQFENVSRVLNFASGGPPANPQSP